MTSNMQDVLTDLETSLEALQSARKVAGRLAAYGVPAPLSAAIYSVLHHSETSLTIDDVHEQLSEAGITCDRARVAQLLSRMAQRHRITRVARSRYTVNP